MSELTNEDLMRLVFVGGKEYEAVKIEIMARLQDGRALLATPAPLSDEPVAWRISPLASAAYVVHTERESISARDRGMLVEPLYLALLAASTASDKQRITDLESDIARLHKDKMDLLEKHVYSRSTASDKKGAVAWAFNRPGEDCRYFTTDPVRDNLDPSKLTPLFTHPTPDDASPSDRKHWNPVYNTDPMQRACGELPEGWQIEIGLERNAGWVDLRSPEGVLVTFDDDADKFDWKIHKAIDRAMQDKGDA